MRFELSVLGLITLLISSANTQKVRMKRQSPSLYQRQVLLWQHRIDLCVSDNNKLKELNDNQIETIYDLFLKLDQLERELNRTKTQLCPSGRELIRTKTELDETKTELNKSKTELNGTQIEINKIKIELKEAKMEFSETLRQFNQTIFKVLLSASTNETMETKILTISELTRTSSPLTESESKPIRDDLSKTETKSIKSEQEQVYSRNEYNEKKEPDFTWTIDDIRNKVKQPNFALLSEVFPLKGYSFGAQAKLTLNEDNNFLYIKLAYKNTNKSESALNLRLVPSARYTINNDTLRYEAFPFAEVAQYDVFYYDRWITCAETLVSDTMSIDVRVEESPADCYSQNGSLSWAIDHFRLKREREETLLEWFHVSPCFLTGPKGYRVGAYVSLNGFGEYEGLSADIVFLTGPFDADLGRSFKHRTTVTLFHPTDPTKVITKSVDKDLRINRLYRINMGAHSEVENLLDGDTLYYRIKIIPA